MIPYNQLSLEDIFSDCQEIYESDKPQFLSLLQQHIDLDEIVPASFRKHFYARTGRSRKYPLNAFLWALIIQRIFSIPTDSLLLVFLQYSRHLREFCGFGRVPDASKITRFKQAFLGDIRTLFDRLVDLTEPICHAIDSAKAGMTIFDSSGIEAWVTENNPKYANRIIKQLKAYAKAMHFDDNYDPYKAAYGSMPSHSAANPNIKQLYIDGHFCYAYKFGIVTNGLGIVRHVDFYNKEFFDKHPEIVINKKSDSPDEDKSIGDSSSLKPILSDFFSLHPHFHPDTFLGDSAFDTIETYGFLRDEFHFSKALIPYNPRNESSLEKVGYNPYGYPTCPKDTSLDMKYAGHCHEKGRSGRGKWVCPKVHMVKGQWVCDCQEPCSTAKKGRTAYTYENMDFRMFPGIQRDSDEWVSLYKIRTIVERSINHFKINMCVAGRKTRNHVTTKADVFLAGIASQLTVIVAHRMSYPQYIRSPKPLIA